MKWWNRTAMPVPKATNYPAKESNDWDLSLINMDNTFSQEQADQISVQHPDLKYLGHGHHGVAYETTPGTVVKYTFEESEIDAAKILMARPCPCVVKILGAEKFSDNPPTWKITTEKVATLSKDEYSFVGTLCAYCDSESHPTFPTLGEILKEFTGTDNEYQYQYKFYMQCYNKYKAMIDCLRSFGFSTLDAHEGNVGVKNGRYVMLDVGLMSS